jgi:hypothetical protein
MKSENQYLSAHSKPARWNAEEDEYLRNLVVTTSHAEIAALLGRTRASVRNRCYRLGLVDKSADWSSADLDALKRRMKA